MEGAESRSRLWKNLKQRLRLKGMLFCGSPWSLRVSDMTIREDQEQEQEPVTGQIPAPDTLPCVGHLPAAEGMNLAAALAAERQSRGQSPAEETPGAALKSLMRLFEETDGLDVVEKEGDDKVCCVCMERGKGAAFIPCGHTYCRVCSRELWLNRGNCPLCNRLILEILDIF